MKVIGNLQGLSAYREIAEEYAPPQFAPMQDVIQTVRAAYQFQQAPIMQPHVALSTSLIFNNGRFLHNDIAFGIAQLIMTPKGDVVATATTDQSDLVLDHLIDLLDTKFGYRLRQSTKTKMYWNQIVIELDAGVAEYIEKLGAIEQVITQIAGKDAPFRLKGLVLGKSTAVAHPNADQIDLIDGADFVLERRADQPFESNRFFSTAPLRTTDHVDALNRIEAALKD